MRVSILTGFLGAGKSTLLRRLLIAPEMQNTAVIINEVAGSEAVAKMESYLELGSACACCVSQPELLQALEKFADRSERVVIETSGLADPLALSFALRSEAMARIATLDAVVTVLDPLHFDSSLAEWRAQVLGADLLAIGKIDLATAEQRQACAHAAAAVNSRAPILDAAALTPSVLFSLDSFHIDTPHAHAHHSDFRTVAVHFSAPPILHELEDALEALPEAVFRGKGWVQTDTGWIRFQLVGGRLQLELDAPPPPHSQSRALFFGRRLESQHLATLPFVVALPPSPFGGGDS